MFFFWGRGYKDVVLGVFIIHYALYNIYPFLTCEIKGKLNNNFVLVILWQHLLSTHVTDSDLDYFW